MNIEIYAPMPNEGLIDSHAHPHFPPLASEEVVRGMDEHGVALALAVATCADEVPRVMNLIDRYRGRFLAAVGVHPCTDESITMNQLKAWCDVPGVVAVGETGLDYFHDKVAVATQKERFATHIEVARALAKPLVIHMRDSFTDVIAQLHGSGGAGEGQGVMHCFTGDCEQAKMALDLGFYISFSGIVSFKKSSLLREVAAYVPADRYLVETDSPYLAPVPHRGKVNEPGFVRYVAEAVAVARGVPFAQVVSETTNNFNRLFCPIK